MWNYPYVSGSVVVSEINVFARSENSTEDTDTSDVAGRDRERTVRGLLFNFQLRVQRPGRELWRHREDQKSKKKTNQLQEEIRLEDRETFQKLSKKKVGKVGQ